MTTESGIASVGGEIATGSVSTDTAAAPVPAAPLEPNPKSYLERMQAAVAVADAGEASPEDQAAEVAASVADAPVSGEDAAETPVETDQVSEEPAPEAPAEQKPVSIPYDQLPDNMRAELRRANLAPEIKEALAQSWYERKAFHDVGFTVEQARQLKSVGFTPEVAGDRLRLHPTLEDAAQDASLANIARTLITDFQSNPSAMLDGLSSNSPDAFPKFAEAVAGRLRTEAPQVHRALVGKAMLNALNVLESEIDENDFESKEKVAFVRNKWFPQTDGNQPRQAGAFDPNDPIHRKYAELQEQQAQQAQQSFAYFGQAVQEYSKQAVMSEVSKRVGEALPKGTSEHVVQRATNEIVNLVANDFFGNRGVMDNINRMVANSDLSQEALNQVVYNIFNRAMPLVAVHAKPVLEFWSKNVRAEQPVTPALTTPQHSAASSRTVASAPSAAKVAAASPPVTQPTHPPKEFIANGRKQGWDTGKIIGAWLSGQR